MGGTENANSWVDPKGGSPSIGASQPYEVDGVGANRRLYSPALRQGSTCFKGGRTHERAAMTGWIEGGSSAAHFSPAERM